MKGDLIFESGCSCEWGQNHRICAAFPELPCNSQEQGMESPLDPVSPLPFWVSLADLSLPS